MNEPEQAFLNKAVECLTGAEIAFERGRYNTCANRCYYACSHAARAALVHAGIRPPRAWGHEFVQAQFVGLLVGRRKLYPATFRNLLLDVQAFRNIADYDERDAARSEASIALVESQGDTGGEFWDARMLSRRHNRLPPALVSGGVDGAPAAATQSRS